MSAGTSNDGGQNFWYFHAGSECYVRLTREERRLCAENLHEVGPAPTGDQDDALRLHMEQLSRKEHTDEN